MNYKKKIFILEPRAGLCNQLNCIAIGIVLGILYDRNIYFNGFQIDYMNENVLTSFTNIIDMNNLNNIIINNNLNVKILDSINVNIDDVPILYSNEQINNIKDIYSYLGSTSNINEEILNIKNPISTYIPNEVQNFFNYMKLNIKFNKKFIDIANSIIEKNELEDFCCIHLRIEDDALEFAQEKFNNLDKDIINDIHKQLYINEIEKVCNLETKIYICTSLNIFNNKNNLFYKVIKKQYNLIDKNDIIKNIELYDNNFNQRELYGIIDYLVAIRSKYFIGCDWSSFSIAIKNNHELSNKDYNLINIWDECSKS